MKFSPFCSCWSLFLSERLFWKRSHPLVWPKIILPHRGRCHCGCECYLCISAVSTIPCGPLFRWFWGTSLGDDCPSKVVRASSNVNRLLPIESFTGKSIPPCWESEWVRLRGASPGPMLYWKKYPALRWMKIRKQNSGRSKVVSEPGDFYNLVLTMFEVPKSGSRFGAFWIQPGTHFSAEDVWNLIGSDLDQAIPAVVEKWIFSYWPGKDNQKPRALLVKPACGERIGQRPNWPLRSHHYQQWIQPYSDYADIFTEYGKNNTGRFLKFNAWNASGGNWGKKQCKWRQFYQCFPACARGQLQVMASTYPHKICKWILKEGFESRLKSTVFRERRAHGWQGVLQETYRRPAPFNVLKGSTKSEDAPFGIPTNGGSNAQG